MAWISIHQQIRDHRKTRDLFRTLKINRAEAIGTLTLIWTWAVDNCNQEGELLSVIKEDIADAAYWRGDPNILYNALVETGWIDELDGKIYLHDWYEFNKPFYDYIAKKEKDKLRKRNGNSSETRQGNHDGNSTENPQEKRGEIHDSHSPAPAHSPTPLVNNNNNNARVENEQGVIEIGETVSETLQVISNPGEIVSKTEGNRPMATGTQAVVWAEKNWGRMIPKGESDSIIAYCDEFFSRGSPDPDAVIIEAMKRCLDADARNMNYLNAVLKDWGEARVLTLAHIEARETERKNQKGHKRNNKDPGDKPPSPPKPGKYENFYL